MGIDEVSALRGEWDSEIIGDIPSAPNDAVVEAAALEAMNSDENLGVGAVDEQSVIAQAPIVEESISEDIPMGAESFLPEHLVNAIKEGAEELAAFIEAEPKEVAPEPVYDYGEDFAPV